MADEASPIIAVFGGTGFLGRRVVRRLAARGNRVRVVSRHPGRSAAVFRDETPRLDFVGADVGDDASVRAAVAGSTGVVNAVSLYVEQGARTFRSVHVEGAARVARIARECGARHLVHVSGVGADNRSPSLYIRNRGEGEDAVREAFPGATILRPTVMVGPDDAFLVPLVELLRRFPLLPVFGRGRTALQPVSVEDIGEAVARICGLDDAAGLYELGGPRIYSYKDLLAGIAGRLGLKRWLVPMPYALWQTLAFGMEMLPHPIITRNQVELMKDDNVASPDLPGFRDLGIEPEDTDRVLDAIIATRRRL